MRRYATHLHEALTGLAADPSEGVRGAVAAGYGACCALLGRERSLQYMKRCAGQALLRLSVWYILPKRTP
jgi:hypothetical protein